MSVDLTMPILVVDDYDTARRIIRNVLQQLGFTNVHEAGDGSDALSRLKENHFGLVISDWNMEPVGGIELLREIRANEQWKHLPFILVSADTKPDCVSAAREAGANDYLAKPFNAEMLRAKLVGLIGEF